MKGDLVGTATRHYYVMHQRFDWQAQRYEGIPGPCARCNLPASDPIHLKEPRRRTGPELERAREATRRRRSRKGRNLRTVASRPSVELRSLNTSIE